MSPIYVHIYMFKVYSKKWYTHKWKEGRKEGRKEGMHEMEKLKTKTAKAFMPNF